MPRHGMNILMNTSNLNLLEITPHFLDAAYDRHLQPWTRLCWLNDVAAEAQSK